MNNIKKISFIILLSFTYFIDSNAQSTPSGIVFQAVAKDVNNNPASNRNVYVKVSIIERISNGSIVYVESNKVFSTNEGVFSITIGQGNRVSGVASLSNLDWLN